MTFHICEADKGRTKFGPENGRGRTGPRAVNHGRSARRPEVCRSFSVTEEAPRREGWRVGGQGGCETGLWNAGVDARRRAQSYVCWADLEMASKARIIRANCASGIAGWFLELRPVVSGLLAKSALWRNGVKRQSLYDRCQRIFQADTEFGGYRPTAQRFSIVSTSSTSPVGEHRGFAQLRAHRKRTERKLGKRAYMVRVKARILARASL